MDRTLTFASFVVGLAVFTASCASTSGGRVLPTTAAERISDEAVFRDHAAFEALQERIRALNDAGVPIRDYHLTQAQAFLDFAVVEYHENDRSGVIEAALEEAVRLVAMLEAPGSELTLGTPVIDHSTRLRPDLWAQADRAKEDPNFACAAASVARLEVELLHAGHEVQQSGWRRARPHLEIAEDLADRANAELTRSPCR